MADDDEPIPVIMTADDTATLITAVLSVAAGVSDATRRDNAIRFRTAAGAIIEIDVWTVRQAPA